MTLDKTLALLAIGFLICEPGMVLVLSSKSLRGSEGTG